MKSNTRRVDSGEDPLIEGTGSEVPDLVRVREQTLAYELGSTWWNPNQMHLKQTTSKLHWFKKPKNTNWDQFFFFKIRAKNINLVFFFETESAGDEAGVICVCFNIRNASSLDKDF